MNYPDTKNQRSINVEVTNIRRDVMGIFETIFFAAAILAFMYLVIENSLKDAKIKELERNLRLASEQIDEMSHTLRLLGSRH